MKITEVDIKNLRNLTYIKFFPRAGINIFLGKNAQGKTNFLEAIYLHGNAKSFRPAEDRFIAQTGSDGYNTRVVYEQEERVFSSEIKYYLKTNKKDFFINHKKTNFKNSKRLKTVLFTPDELFLVKGYPALRRNFVEYLLRQVSEEYAYISDNYNKTLRHRNFLLRQDKTDPEVFSVLNKLFAELAAQVIVRRILIINQLNQAIEKFYDNPNFSNHKLRIKYALSFEPESSELDEDNLKSSLEQKLVLLAGEEYRRKRTLCGPHLDDLNFYLDDKLAKIFASQGQQRNIAIILKLAELAVFNHIKSYYPVFILDEVLSELDNERKNTLLNLLVEAPFQSFITTVSLTNVKVPDLPINYVQDGQIYEENV